MGAIALFVANVDLLIIPYILQPMNLSFWTMFWVSMLIANLEILGWFYFWRWFAWKWLPKREKIEEAVEFVKSVIELLKEHGLLKTIIIKALWTFRWATNPNRLLSLKKLGHFWMFFLGAEPFFTGGRLLGVVLCAATRWKAGLISLCIGNAIHVYISIRTWNLIFFLWDEYRIELIGASIVGILLGLLYRKIRGDKESPKSP